MSNKFLDQKRSSLDLSDSESDGENYRKGGYSNKYNLKESYSSPDEYQSPDTNSMGPTPKSILKENLGSASKSRKNILINETLNETHRIPQKSESNMSSPDKNMSSVERDSKYRDYIREEQSKSSGYSSSPNKAGGTEGTDDDEEYDSKMSAKYSKDTYGEENTSFKNRLVVGNISSSENGLSDFKRAHVRKLQQEREQEISSRAIRESADQVREKWQLEKERRELDTYGLRSEKENGFSYSGGFGDKKPGLRDYEDEYGYRKADTLLNRGVDPSEKFERIENKISNLEQDLNSYSKNLVKSTVKQEEKNKDLDKVCEEFEDRMKDLKDEIDQSINEHRRSDKKMDALARGSRGFSEERTRPEKTASDKGKIKAGTSTSLSKSSKHGKSADRFKGGKTKGASTTFKKLQAEIDRLRYENVELKDKLSEKEMKEKARTIKAKTLAGPDLDRETELLDTIERIKKKLRHTITKKIQEEKNKQMEAVREDAAAQSFGRNYTSYGLHYKDILKRKALEDRTMSKENMMLLHKGLPTTYKNYESPIFAEKLTKSKKKI